jgi:SAM-dependent methyltransferase
MTPALLDYLCDPKDRSVLKLVDPIRDPAGSIQSGRLVSASGHEYPIRDGVPRFVPADARATSVKSFGDEWNELNFDQFRLNWLEHTVRNTFGSTDAFRGKVIVDAGAGSGMQSRWMAEAGAARVIALELSHSVDGVIPRNLAGAKNVDVVQCSIDEPPIKDGCIDGIVICHNVIQHTPSVEHTAGALWRLVRPGGELVFNCYLRNDFNLLRKLRFAMYRGLRGVLSRRSFGFLLWYARTMSALRFVPGLGFALERANFMVLGHVPPGPRYLRRRYRAGVLNTFDWFGSHAFQHHKSRDEIRRLVETLQPDPGKVSNLDTYLRLPAPPPGCAIRIRR